MLSIRENNNTIIIKNSRFITYIFQVHSKEDIKKLLDNIRDKYRDATHVCYAYILDGNIKCYDDGEPSGTAGMPILEVLKKNNLNHVLCVVIRYFGKIKLGASGLVRAYANSASECIRDNVITLSDAYYVDICFSYDNSKLIDKLVSEGVILDKIYDDKVLYKTILKDKDIEVIKEYKDIEINILDKTYL